MTNENSVGVEHKDFRGRQISVGDTVAYPVRSGSAMWMKEGIVEGCEVEQGLYGPKPILLVKHSEPLVYKVRRLDRVVVVV